MLADDDPTTRLAARRIRSTYLAATYSVVGWQAAGIEPPLLRASTAPPALPPSWLVLPAPSSRVAPTPVEAHVDWLIIGSGPAGAVLAHELRAGGKRVLLVEQGPFVLPGCAQTRDLPGLTGARLSRDGSLIARFGRTVGGGSTVNVDLAFAPVADRLARWGWPVADFAAADRFIRARLGTRTASLDEINANNRLLWDGAQARGLTPRLYDLNTWPVGQSPWTLTDKRSPVSTFVLPAMSEPDNPLAILPDARVDRVLIDAANGRALGVDLTILESTESSAWRDPQRVGARPGARHRVLAQQIVIAAGALGTPALLLRSGLRRPEIGRGLIAHPSMPLIGEFDEVIDEHVGTPASVFVDCSASGYLFESMSAGPDYIAAMLPGNAHAVRDTVRGMRHLGGFGVMLIDSVDPDNRVHEDGSIDYRLSDADRVARELRFVPGRTVVTSAHAQATCKMGDVVDRDHRVRGFANLFIVDSSVFPESAGANPMQTIYAMAKVFADRQR